MKHSIYAYPWNIHDAGATAQEIANLGLSGVNLAVSYHAGKFIQPGDKAARVVFPEDGTVYFQPRAKYGVLKPLAASVVDGGDPTKKLARHIPVNGWMVLLHNSRLGFAHPEYVVRNAFGDPYFYSLCPSHGAVRDYAATMASDFAEHHDVSALLLETPGFLTYGHGYHHEFAQVRPNTWLDALLGLCFCDGCRAGAKAAGINAERLRSRVKAEIDDYFAADVEFDGATGLQRLGSANQEIPELAAFHDWRCEQVTLLVARIRSEVRRQVAVRTIATCQRPHATAYLEGMDLPALARAADGIECPLYQSDLGDLAADIAWLKERVEPVRNSAILRPAWPDWRDEASFRSAYRAAHAAGFGEINFYNFGMLRPANRRWLELLLTE